MRSWIKWGLIGAYSYLIIWVLVGLLVNYCGQNNGLCFVDRIFFTLFPAEQWIELSSWARDQHESLSDFNPMALTVFSNAAIGFAAGAVFGFLLSARSSHDN
jgi:hypothetical protein